MVETIDDIGQVLSLINSGDTNGALLILNALIESNPKDQRAIFLKGEALRCSGSLAAAEKIFFGALQFPDPSGEVLFRLGLTQLGMNKFDAAEKAFALLVERLPGHHLGRIYRGLTALQQNRLADAEMAFRAALEIDPGNALALTNLVACLGRQGRSEDAIGILEAAMQRSPQEEFAYLLVRAYYEASQFDKAEILCCSMTEQHPEQAQWFDHLGIVRQSLGRHPEASAASARAVELNPGSPVYAAHHGTNLRQAGRTAEAEAFLRLALSLDPALSDAWLRLAGVLADKGQLEDAMSALDDHDRCANLPARPKRSVVIAVVDFAPGSPYNLRTLLDDLRDFDGEVICVFNDDEVYEEMHKHPRVDKFSYNKHNVGISRGWNIGINHAEGETIHILNADLHVSVDTLNRLESWLHRLPDALCVGPMGALIDSTTLKDTKQIVERTFSDPIEVDIVSGQMFSLHAGRLHNAGIMFDPRLAPYFGEELDLGLKAKQNGLKMYAVPESDYYHIWGLTKRDRPLRFFDRPIDRLRTMAFNDILLKQKYRRSAQED